LGSLRTLNAWGLAGWAFFGYCLPASIPDAAITTAFRSLEVVPMDASPAAFQHFRPALPNQQLPQFDFP